MFSEWILTGLKALAILLGIRLALHLLQVDIYVPVLDHLLASFIFTAKEIGSRLFAL